MSRIVDVEPLDCLAWKDGEHGTTFDDGVLWVLRKIEELPTIEERKTGKWIYTPTEPLGYICSECKEGCCRYNFCPNCGVKMEVLSDE